MYDTCNSLEIDVLAPTITEIPHFHWLYLTEKGLTAYNSSTISNTSSADTSRANLLGICLASPACCSAEALRSSCLCHFCACSAAPLLTAWAL